MTLSIPMQRRQMRQQIKERKKEVLPKLKKAVSDAKKARTKRLKECERECNRAKKAAKQRAEKARKKLEAHIKRAKAKAKTACSFCSTTATSEGLDRVQKALADVETEAKAIDKLRIQAASMISERGKKGGKRSAELRAESDDMVRFNLADDEEMISLFNKVKTKIKKGPRRTRTEAFLEYVHDHPEELDELRAKREQKWEREAESMFRERSEFLPGQVNDLEQLCAELEALKAAEKHSEVVPF